MVLRGWDGAFPIRTPQTFSTALKPFPNIQLRRNGQLSRPEWPPSPPKSTELRRECEKFVKVDAIDETGFMGRATNRSADALLLHECPARLLPTAGETPAERGSG